MELVYLWVEEYKNIHRQGFNFSPRFECKFHDEYDENGKLKDDCRLEIIEKKEDEYIKDFFGENINVTAIVGKNGSGKSSLLEIFEKLISFSQVEIKNNYLLIYYIDNKLRHFSNIKFKSDVTIDKNYSVDFNGFMTFVAQLPYPMYDRKKYHPESITFDSQYSLYKTVTFESQKIAKMIAYTFRNNIPVENRLFNFTPVILRIKAISQLETLPVFEDEVKKLYKDNSISDKVPSRGLGEILEEVRDAYENEISEIESEVEIIEPEPEDIFENYLKNLVIINQLQDVFLESNSRLIFGDARNNIVKLDACLKENKLKKLPYNCNFKIFLSLINKEVNIKDLDEYDIERYFDIYYDLLSFDFIDINNRHLYDLSHGERTIFSLLLNLILKAESSRDNLFIIDELEISLHPNWQKKILNELINSLNKLDKTIHFIFISHSPFLLSDIPKQNIIFLDKDEEGKCKVLKHNEVMNKKQTFGANIHTLLSDSFFMEDGLMGEFARGKINEVIKYLRDDSENKNSVEDMPKYDNWLYDKENLKKIIDAIGEPFLRHKILELYYDKFTDDATEAERKKELLKQKERIERELSRYD